MQQALYWISCAAHFLLHILCCKLYTAHFLQHFCSVHFLLHIPCSTFFVAHFVLYILYCTFSLHILYCTFCVAKFVLYICYEHFCCLFCAWCNVLHILCSILCVKNVLLIFGGSHIGLTCLCCTICDYHLTDWLKFLISMEAELFPES